MSIATAKSSIQPNAPSAVLARASRSLADVARPQDSFTRVLSAVSNPLTPADGLVAATGPTNLERVAMDRLLLGGPAVQRHARRHWLAGRWGQACATYVGAGVLQGLGAAAVVLSGGATMLLLLEPEAYPERCLPRTPAGTWETRLVEAIEAHRLTDDWNPRDEREAANERARIAWVRAALAEQPERLRYSDPIDHALGLWAHDVEEPSKAFDGQRRKHALTIEMRTSRSKLADCLARGDADGVASSVQESRALLARSKPEAQVLYTERNLLKVATRNAEAALASLPCVAEPQGTAEA